MRELELEGKKREWKLRDRARRADRSQMARLQHAKIVLFQFQNQNDDRRFPELRERILNLTSDKTRR